MTKNGIRALIFASVAASAIWIAAGWLVIDAIHFI